MRSLLLYPWLESAKRSCVDAFLRMKSNDDPSGVDTLVASGLDCEHYVMSESVCFARGVTSCVPATWIYIPLPSEVANVFVALKNFGAP